MSTNTQRVIEEVQICEIINCAMEKLEEMQRDNPEPVGGWGQVGESRAQDPTLKWALNLLVRITALFTAAILILWH